MKHVYFEIQNDYSIVRNEYNKKLNTGTENQWNYYDSRRFLTLEYAIEHAQELIRKEIDKEVQKVEHYSEAIEAARFQIQRLKKLLK